VSYSPFNSRREEDEEGALVVFVVHGGGFTFVCFFLIWASSNDEMFTIPGSLIVSLGICRYVVVNLGAPGGGDKINKNKE